MAVKISVNVDQKRLKEKLLDLVNDPATMLAAHNLLYKKMDPYVPFDTGTMAQSVEITSQHVRYTQPYAHYMYEGIVYGPNIPIIENGVVVGFFSRPGVTKTPTGKYIVYDKTHHPLATRHWDEAMMRAEGESFTKQLEKLLISRMNKV